ncbi:hypothetical protein D3C75_1311710 [compost metagenome]
MHEHAVATWAVDAQFLRATGDGVVLALQVVLGVAGGHEATHAYRLRQVLGARAHGDGRQHQQEHRP